MVCLCAAKLPRELSQKLIEIQSTAKEAEEGFNLGDLLQVKGRIRVFRDVREISASHAGTTTFMFI